MTDDQTQPYGAQPTPPEGQDQPPPPPGQYQPPPPYQPPQPPGQYQPPPPYQPPSGGYQPPPPPPYQPPSGGYPPPPGGYPPPPGGYSGGYAPPPPSGGYGAPQPGGWPSTVGAPLAEWPQRAIGWLIDWGIGVGIFVISLIVGAILGSVSSGLFVLLRVLGSVAALIWAVWVAVQIGQTGQSPGMRAAGLKAIRKDSGAPLGVGMAILRWLVHVVLGVLCFIPLLIDYLFPLWDSEKQTIADKAVSSVVIVVPKQGFSLQPPSSSTY